VRTLRSSPKANGRGRRRRVAALRVETLVNNMMGVLSGQKGIPGAPLRGKGEKGVSPARNMPCHLHVGLTRSRPQA
jgi:hypothetical protein